MSLASSLSLDISLRCSRRWYSPADPAPLHSHLRLPNAGPGFALRLSSPLWQAPGASVYRELGEESRAAAAAAENVWFFTARKIYQSREH